MAIRRPPTHECVRSAPQMAKNAPISIIPSRPMLTTPLRSEKSPPIAANVRGVAERKVADRSADHTTTVSRCEEPERVARTPPAIPIAPAATAPHPARRSRRRIAHAPAAIAARPTRIGGTIERSVSGGSASQKAITPSAIPT